MNIDELLSYLQGYLEVLEEWVDEDKLRLVSDDPLLNTNCGKADMLRKVVDLINENYETLSNGEV